MTTPGFHAHDIETMPRDQLEALQLERLVSSVRRLRENVPLMANRLIGIDDPKSLDDLRHFPFLRKQDLRDNYPFGLFAVGRADLARVHASSGTTGKQTVVGYTADDLAVWAECVARCLRGAGIEPGQMLHNAYGYGLFTGGLGLHMGAEEAGIIVVPVSGGNTELQLTLIADFAPEAICCTPSYALTLAERLGDRARSSSLQVGILGAEPWSEKTREAIEQALGIAAVNIYGLSEVIGPGVSCETADRDGLVIMEDHFLPEIVHPETGDPLPDGEVGVLVLTSLTKQAFPVLRYWTNDLCSITREPAPCGRTHARMSFVLGRADDMLVIRGVNVYPSQVEHTLLGIVGVSPHFQLVVDREGTLDTLHVRVERDEASTGDRPPDEAIAGEIVHAMRSSLGVGVTVAIEPHGSLPRSEGGKLGRTIDNRSV
ncbi:MAG: phenylacetate--CoA ligase [Acidimicrobiia bacterium]|nr:phenylacetate--CoA ligase [Acidimicrobiia bacterium]